MFVAVSASTRTSIAGLPEMVGRTSSPVSTSAPLPRKLAWSVGPPLRRALEKASVDICPQPQP